MEKDRRSAGAYVAQCSLLLLRLPLIMAQPLRRLERLSTIVREEGWWRHAEVYLPGKCISFLPAVITVHRVVAALLARPGVLSVRVDLQGRHPRWILLLQLPL